MSMSTTNFMNTFYPNQELVWDQESQDYILVDNTPITRVSYLEDGDVYPEEDFHNPLCMVNCMNCKNIEGLDQDRLYPMCDNAGPYNHTHCFLCHDCHHKLNAKYFERNYNSITDGSKKRTYTHTPCGLPIHFE